jgi:hypothetical protein
MNIDLDFLRKTAAARYHVGNWLENRPSVGLDVTDVSTMVAGFDYLIQIINDISGTNIKEFTKPEQLHSTMQITFLD